MDWIIRYAIVAMDSSPMYGHGQTMAKLDDKEQAIRQAKKLAQSRKNICVEERRYACPENLCKGLTFDQSICWACWL